MIIDAPKSHHIPALRRLWQEAFEDSDAFLDGFFSTGFSPRRCRCLWEDGTLAAALYWFDCNRNGNKVAYVYAVATLKDFQGKGLCKALMENTHEVLKESGYAGAILVPGNQGLFNLYSKLGYMPCCKMTELTMEASKESAKLRQIAYTEYKTLQEKFYPADSVFHGDTALAFVATFCNFYRGEGFAFCGSADDDTFYFQEFLGDTTFAPQILASLEAQKGILQIPGDRDHAMYLDFEGETTLPNYFNISMG